MLKSNSAIALISSMSSATIVFSISRLRKSDAFFRHLKKSDYTKVNAKRRRFYRINELDQILIAVKLTECLSYQ